jgi:hypothetical protein
MTTLAVVAVGLLLPVMPFAGRLGFAVPPVGYLGFVATATAVYLMLVERMKRLVVRRLGAG